MTTRAHGPVAGLRWLKRGINLGRHNPRAIFGGIVLVALAAILPTLLQLLLQPLVGAAPVGTAILSLLAIAVWLLLMPPLVGGYLRVVDASEGGRPTGPGEVLSPFRSAPVLRRLIGLGLVMLLAYVVLGGALVYLVSPGFPAWYMQIALQAQAGPVNAAALPAAPDGLAAMVALGLLLGAFLGSTYAIASAQIAIGGHRLGRALSDGVTGTLRNLLPLLVLGVIGVVVMVVVFVTVALLALAVGQAIGTAVYLLMMLVVYVVVFGTVYHLWREVAADAAAPSAAPPPGQVEL